MIANSSPPIRQTESVVANRRQQLLGDRREHVVADRVPVDVVDLLEVVEIEHHERDASRATTRRAAAPCAGSSWNARWFSRPGQRIGLRLLLERRADMRVVERERRRVAEPHREPELLVREDCVVALSIDVERALEVAARDQRDDDQRLRLRRRAGHDADARVQMSLVGEHRLAVLDRPAGDPLAEREPLREHLRRPA